MDRFSTQISRLLTTTGIGISDLKECQSKYHKWEGFTLQRYFWYGYEPKTGSPVVIPYYNTDINDDELKVFVRRPDGKWKDYFWLNITSIKPDTSSLRWRGGKLSFQQWLVNIRFDCVNWYDTIKLTPSNLEGLIQEYRIYIKYGRLPKFIWQTFERGVAK